MLRYVLLILKLLLCIHSVCSFLCVIVIAKKHSTHFILSGTTEDEVETVE
jgi:hypothetical protein